MDNDFLAAVDDNLASHAAHLHRFVPGASVHRDDDVQIANSGLNHDTFNTISKARFRPDVAERRVQTVIAGVRATGLPFSWWVGPTTTPADLPDLLTRAGACFGEAERAMAANLAGVHRPIDLPELETVDVTTAAQVSDLAFVVASNWNPYASDVARFYELAHAGILAGDCKSRFVVGYAEGQPVSAAEIHVDSDVAGLYGVVTLAGHRRKRYATAVTLRALDIGRRLGLRYAVLQAYDAGAMVHQRMGFTTIDEYVEYAI